MGETIDISKEDIVFSGNPNGSGKARNMFEYWMKKYIKKFTINGLYNIPKKGAFLLVANHQSHADGPVIWKALSGIRDDVWAVAGKVIADPRARDFYRDSYPGLIYVERQEEVDRKEATAYLLKAFDYITEKLIEGIPFFIFSESTRSKDGKLLQGQWRTILPALIAKVPIIPCSIIGTGNLFSYEPSTVKVEDFLSGYIEKNINYIDELIISFGSPTTFMDHAEVDNLKGIIDISQARYDRNKVKEIMDEIMSDIAIMLPEHMWGHYAELTKFLSQPI